MTLNPKQFQALPDLTENNRSYISRTNSVRGGFTVEERVARLISSRPHPQVHDPAKMRGTLNTLAPGAWPPTQRGLRHLS